MSNTLAGLACTAVAVMACAGCAGSGSSPTSPSESQEALPPGAAIQFVSGETEAGAAGAIVSIAGRHHVADADGIIRRGDATPLGEWVEVAHPEYLHRLTIVRDRGLSRLSLWPLTSPTGLDEDLTRRVVFGNGLRGVEGLIRWSPSVTTVFVVPSPEIQADAGGMAIHRRACAILTDATNAGLRFEVAAEATGPVVFTKVDPLSPVASTGAGMTRTYDGFSLTGGTVIFKNPTGPRNLGVLLHELGHAFGLSHSPHGARDIMGPGPDDHVDFSAAEKLAMRLMLQRQPGTVFPDNDRRVPLAGSAASFDRVRCETLSEAGAGPSTSPRRRGSRPATRGTRPASSG